MLQQVLSGDGYHATIHLLECPKPRSWQNFGAFQCFPRVAPREPKHLTILEQFCRCFVCKSCFFGYTWSGGYLEEIQSELATQQSHGAELDTGNAELDVLIFGRRGFTVDEASDDEPWLRFDGLAMCSLVEKPAG